MKENEKPQTIEYQLESIPNELKSYDNWIVWRYEYDTDREEWTKVPRNPQSGRKARSTDPETWVPFEIAARTYRGSEKIDGIGFCFENSPFTGVDYDDCITNGELVSWADETLELIDSYSELSPSGDGLHTIVRGDKPNGRCRREFTKGEIEVYDTGRYFTFTGNVYGGKDGVHERQTELEELQAKISVDSEESTGSEPVGNDLSDEEIIEIAENPGRDGKLHKLWKGDYESVDLDDDSHSGADMSLTTKLAFWTGGDPEQIDRLFRQSDLYREEKWERLADEQIEKAINYQKGNGEFYTGSADLSDPWHVRFNNWYSRLKEDEDMTVPSPDTRVGQVANMLQDDYIFATPDGSDNKPIYWYNEDSGMYEPDGETLIKRELTDHIANHILPIRKHEDVLTIIRRQNPVDRDEFNPPGYVCLGNGLWDIKNEQLRSHTPDFKFTRGVDIDYNPDAECPEIWDFVRDITGLGEDARTLLEFVAFGLMPGYNPRKMFFLHGETSNGKSTFFKLVEEFFAKENISNMSLEQMANNRFAPANLNDSMVNLDAEVSNTHIEVNKIERLKKLTGDDGIMVEKKYKDSFMMGNSAKLAFAANNLPRFPPKSEAIAQRIVSVELPYRFTKDGNDGHKQAVSRHELLDKLTTEEEFEGLLKFALESINRIDSQGFANEQELTAEDRYRKYIREADPIKKFADTCITESTHGGVPKDVLHSAYVEFALEEGDSNPANKGKLIEELGKHCEFTDKRPLIGEERVRCLKGITLSNDDYISEVHKREMRNMYGVQSFKEADYPDYLNDYEDVSQQAVIDKIRELLSHGQMPEATAVQMLANEGLKEDRVKSQLDSLKQKGVIIERDNLLELN